MVDFRYHALSLVAVFLALGIGILLGVTIGDSLLSETDKNLRESLRGDLREARDESRDQARLGALRESALRDTAPLVASGRLRGRRLALIGLGELPGNVAEGVEEALGLGDGTLDSQTTFDVPDELDELAGALGVSVPVRSPARAKRLGARLGRALIVGRRPARRLRDELPRRFRGAYRGRVDGFVLYRQPPPDGDQRELREAFEDGLTEVLYQPIVGVERLETDPSQVGWYDDHAVASVDDLDLAAGRLALVLALDLRAKGRFGFKGSAERTLPELPGG